MYIWSDSQLVDFFHQPQYRSWDSVANWKKGRAHVLVGTTQISRTRLWNKHLKCHKAKSIGMLGLWYSTNAYVYVYIYIQTCEWWYYLQSPREQTCISIVHLLLFPSISRWLRLIRMSAQVRINHKSFLSASVMGVWPLCIFNLSEWTDQFFAPSTCAFAVDVLNHLQNVWLNPHVYFVNVLVPSPKRNKKKWGVFLCGTTT